MVLPEITDEQNNFLELVVKIIIGIWAVIVFSRGVEQFNISQERQYRLEIFKTQQDAVKKLMEYTALLAVLPKTSPVFVETNNSFEKFRRGELFIISNENISGEVGFYFSLLEKYKGGSRDVTRSVLSAESSRITNMCIAHLNSLTKIDRDEKNSCSVITNCFH